MINTQVAVSHTTLDSSHDAGIWLARSVLEKLGGNQPDAVIVFASPAYDYQQLLAAISATCQSRIVVGCSSAGEFSGCASGTASASVMALRSDSMRFNAGVASGLMRDQATAIGQILPVFTGSSHPDYPYRSALVLTDALAGYTDQLIHQMTVATGGSYQLFGGGAADDAKFQQTHVFYGNQAYGDAVVVLEMLSKKPIGLGVRHGWQPAGKAMRVTEAAGNRLISLNAVLAVEVFEEHAARSGQVFNRADPFPFFLHNVIGIETGAGHKLRVPLFLNADGSVTCAAEVPLGATVSLMSGSAESACEAARQAAQAALAGLQGEQLAGSLVFDCAATRLRMGQGFSNELHALATALDSENFAGCNTYGQIARAEGQFNGFHNCTAIVCAIPQ